VFSQRMHACPHLALQGSGAPCAHSLAPPKERDSVTLSLFAMEELGKLRRLRGRRAEGSLVRLDAPKLLTETVKCAEEGEASRGSGRLTAARPSWS